MFTLEFVVYCLPFLVPQSGPLNVSVYNLSSTSIHIQWSPVPEQLRLGNIIHYVFNITEVLTGYTRVLIFDGDALNATVGNLSKFTEHAIMGAAVNSKGQSNFTSATIILTNEDGKCIRLKTFTVNPLLIPPIK